MATKIIVMGARGRMGSRLVSLINSSGDLSLVTGIDRGDSLEGIFPHADVIIDFTTADAAPENAILAAKFRTPIVIGTTGLDNNQQKNVREAARDIPIVFAPNMSIGVNVMWKVIETAARALGKNFKADISETHHAHKLDKPSGTAKKMLDIIVKESGHKPADVGVQSIRTGEVIGDHVVHFTSPGEILTIEHHAISRDVFAEGALAAARWIVGKPAGLYGMDDVLGLKK